jgi:hypothetical protein
LSASENPLERLFEWDTITSQQRYMQARKQFDYFLLSYNPNITQIHSICMAVVLLDSETGGEAFCRLKAVEGWQSRVKRFEPNAHMELLEAILQDVDQRISEPGTRSAMIEFIETSFSNTLRASTRKRCEGEEPDKLLEALSGSNTEAN